MITRISFRRFAVVVSAALSAAGVCAAQSAGAAAFETSCGVCHALEPTAGKIGPPLTGVFGRKAASVAGYPYSAALKSSNVVWTRTALDAFLMSPAKLIPGTRMMINVPDPASRKDIVDFLADPDGKR